MGDPWLPDMNNNAKRTQKAEVRDPMLTHRTLRETGPIKVYLEEKIRNHTSNKMHCFSCWDRRSKNSGKVKPIQEILLYLYTPFT